MRAIQPIRQAVILKYFRKYKWQKAKREEILAAIEHSEEYSKEILGDEYVHFMDAIPEIKTFLAEMEVREKLTPYTKVKSETRELTEAEIAEKKLQKKKNEKKRFSARKRIEHEEMAKESVEDTGDKKEKDKDKKTQ